jgi:hypothetical protein
VEESISKELLETTSHSGFLFQIGVRKEIERTSKEHKWRVSAEEHHWSHPKTGSTGFIDLIAEHEEFIFSLIIECKRVRAQKKKDKATKTEIHQVPSWIFPAPLGYSSTQGRISGFVARRGYQPLAGEARQIEPNLRGWEDDISFAPHTLESSYCLFDTQVETNPTIERACDTLLPSVEAAGSEWLTFRDVVRSESRLFMPVIVTNATLYTCVFDPETISMADGTLPGGDFQEVPFVRFRKGLAMGQSKLGYASNFKHANQQQQRTVLIVNSKSLASTLGVLFMENAGHYALNGALENLSRQAR